MHNPNDMIDTDTVLKNLACFTSRNINTGRIIEVALWGEEIEPGESLVSISTDEGSFNFSLEDIRGVQTSIQSLLHYVDH